MSEESLDCFLEFAEVKDDLIKSLMLSKSDNESDSHYIKQQWMILTEPL